MKKEIKTVDEKKQIVRITTPDERWYARPTTDPDTGLPVFEYLPSSTWIAGCWPKGIQYYKWLATHGWDEAQAIKTGAANRGSKVHRAIDYLEENGHLPVNTQFLNMETGMNEDLTSDELEAIMSFVRWHTSAMPQTLASEMTVFGDGYAGTLDRIYRIGNLIWIVDFKTSQYMWPSMKLQLSSYSHADIDYQALGITDEEWANRGNAVLQLGYRMNKVRFKWTDVGDHYDNFLIAKRLWEEENPDAKIKERDFPLDIKLREETTNGRTKKPRKEKLELADN